MDLPHALARDRRFMAAAIRLSRHHTGLTQTNPSVGALIVADGVIVGSGVTAVGGRPHAETQALAQAGARARGATAYVTLEPCAHYGLTPPCAEALVAAGIHRVVCAAPDPDHRVTGRGFEILRQGGVDVDVGIIQNDASETLSGYLKRSTQDRPEVVLKLALSRDGRIGLRHNGQVAITGVETGRQVHLLRAFSDAILIGVSTAIADDPQLTCRLPGLEARSPKRYVIDPHGRLPATSKLAQTARTVPTCILVDEEAVDPERLEILRELGMKVMAAPFKAGMLDLAALLQMFGAKGISTLMVEGGAVTAASFLKQDLVDRLILLTGPAEIGEGGIDAPILPAAVPANLKRLREYRFGDDLWQEWVRTN